ncbi:MAG: Ig-like domain-containing protein, partial [Lutibacter sp.]|nr:Ig-like domain-containing protein [Lutibacter sp.]
QSANTITVNVTSVNDVPSFTKGANEIVLEDATAVTVGSWATAISAGPADESTQTVSFVITNNTNTGLFSSAPAISSTGTLTYTPAANANGSATISVKITDNGGTANGGVDESGVQTFVINVTAVNDAPSFTKGADETVLEDAGAQSVPGWATAISKGPANESGQALTFTVTNDNNALFSVQPAVASNGTLTYTSALNANGTANVTVYLKDDGGTANDGVDQSANQMFVINVTAVNDAPVVTNNKATQNVQYSDPIETVTISATDVDNDHDDLTANTSWKMSTAGSYTNGLPPNLSLTLTSVSGSPKTWELTGNIMTAPGTYFVKVKVIDGTANPANNLGETIFEIIVTQEDAVVDYTGQQFIRTANATVDVLLTASINDFNDGDSNRGNISNAKVKFVIMGNSAGTGNYESGWLNVNLVDPSNTTDGYVSWVWEGAPVPGIAGDADIYDIKVVVDGAGYYIGETESVLNITHSDTRDFISGGGYIVPTNSLGTYKAENGKKINFGFNIKWNKSFKNLQGKLNVIYRVNGRIYQVKTNATNSLSIKENSPCDKNAVFTAKGNLTDITDPLIPRSLGSGLTVELKITDKGEPGVGDSWGLTLYDNNNTLVFSSTWSNGKTLELLLGGGNIVVHSGTDCRNNQGNLKAENVETAIKVTQPIEVVADLSPFNVTAYPNPSADYFTLKLQGMLNEEIQKVEVNVFDLLGRQVYTKQGNAQDSYEFGQQFQVGVYLVTVKQGNNVASLKVIKK